jgi:hypothetical protein
MEREKSIRYRCDPMTGRIPSPPKKKNKTRTKSRQLGLKVSQQQNFFDSLFFKNNIFSG